MRGTDALIETLARRGIDTVFGVPGGAVLPLYDALAGSPVRHVLMRHEAAAGHAAEGWARVAGKPGVALGTSGPGAVNLLTAVADAWMDRFHRLHLRPGRHAPRRDDGVSGDGRRGHGDPGRQALEHRPAWRRSRRGARRGACARVERETRSGAARGSGRRRKAPATRRRHPSRERPPARRPRSRTLTAAAELIGRSARPLVLAGAGVVASGADVELAAFTAAAGAHRHDPPRPGMRRGTRMARDARRVRHPGRKLALHQADCIVAVGARFDDRLTGNLDGFAPHARVIHIDADASELGKLVAAEIAICADARLTLRRLTAALGPAPDRSAWWASIGNTLCVHPLAPAPAHAGEAALDALDVLLDRDAVITTDVGLHQMWAAHRLSLHRGRRWITSGGAGNDGVPAFPRRAARKRRPLTGRSFCVTGDGSLLMHMQELVTAAAEQLPVKVLLLDNQALGMVHAQQERFFSGAFAAELGAHPDWPAVARACGVGVADSIESLLAEADPRSCTCRSQPRPSACRWLPLGPPPPR